MPNLNKLRGGSGGRGGLAGPRYGLSQPRTYPQHHTSDSRLQPPGSRPGPAPPRGVTSHQPRPQPALRKLSGIARPAGGGGGIPRPGISRLPGPARFRGPAPPRPASSRLAPPRAAAANRNWPEDCY